GAAVAGFAGRRLLQADRHDQAGGGNPRPWRRHRDPQGRGRASREAERRHRRDPRQRQVPGNQRQVLQFRRLWRINAQHRRSDHRTAGANPAVCNVTGHHKKTPEKEGTCMESAIWTLLSWGPEGWSRSIAYGVFVTVSLALATLPLGLIIGFLVAVAKQSAEPSMRLAGNIYTTIFRGLPELLTLFHVFYGAQFGIQQAVQLFSPGTTVEINS